MRHAVMFSSLRTSIDEGYDEWNDKLFELVEQQDGYLGYDSYRNADGRGVTISYWRDLESLQRWRDDQLHKKAQELGRKKWYLNYKIRVCKVEREYEFTI